MPATCDDKRFEIIKRAKEDLLNKTNIEMAEDEMEVLDVTLLRCWQMGWLDRYDDSNVQKEAQTIMATLEAIFNSVRHDGDVSVQDLKILRDQLYDAFREFNNILNRLGVQ